MDLLALHACLHRVMLCMLCFGLACHLLLLFAV